MFTHYKKILFLILILLFSFNSCKTKNEKKKYLIGFSQFNKEINVKKAMIKSMEIEAQFYNEIELLILDSQSEIDKQITDIETLINKQVDVLIISPIAPKPLKAVISKAAKANIPVIILDQQIKDVTYESFIGVDNYNIGENAGKYISSLKTQANIIEIKSWAGTNPTIKRSLGFKNIVTQNKNLNIVGTTQEKYDDPGIKKHFKEVLLKNENTNFVFAHNDALALEAYEVAQELGIEKTIQFIGVGVINFTSGGIELIEKNILKSSVLYSTGGKEAIQTAIRILDKEKVNKNNLLPSLMIDSNNIDVIKRQNELILNQELDIEQQQVKIKNQYQLYTSQKSFLSYTLLSLGIIGVLLLLTFLNKRKLRKQNKLLNEYVDKIKTQKSKLEKTTKELENLNESTNNFFTGVSHDFKTPISLILSSTESLLTEKNGVKPKEYELIYNNSKRLLRMINQLLDFKKLENNKTKIKVVKTDIIHFTKTIFNHFEKEALKRNIDFTFNKNTNTSLVYIDTDLFDNILFNLLSNAFKFTTNKGSITINVNETEDKVYISVKDSGIGILKSEVDKVFNQFFQGSNNKQTSSGIGLYITKEYLKQHNGAIEVISSEEEGSEFKLYIPKGKSHFNSSDVIIDDNITINNQESIDIDSYTFEKNETAFVKDEEKDTLLIIEDNTDLRTFLKNKLSEKYNIEESDGIDAVQKALDLVPDIIISDVNLPEKNGFEITKILKEDEKTSHIPILILTALSSSDAHLQGLKNGVDMFLTKPFNLAILHQSLKTLSYNRKKLQQFYKQNLTIKLPVITKEDDKVSLKKEKKKDLERQFFEKINILVLKNIDNSEFTVEILAENLFMSRVQLYRKTKAVLGISISDYIQNIRLEKAKELLLEDNLTISDVAYSTGFSSPNYFSTSFKNKYGKTPNKYKKQELAKNKR